MYQLRKNININFIIINYLVQNVGQPLFWHTKIMKVQLPICQVHFLNET